MNNPFQFPINYFFDIQRQISILNEKINNIEEKLKKLESTDKKDYLHKDDNYYMI